MIKFYISYILCKDFLNIFHFILIFVLSKRRAAVFHCFWKNNKHLFPSVLYYYTVHEPVYISLSLNVPTYITAYCTYMCIFTVWHRLLSVAPPSGYKFTTNPVILDQHNQSELGGVSEKCQSFSSTCWQPPSLTQAQFLLLPGQTPESPNWI